jgi:hypothetical protein
VLTYSAGATAHEEEEEEEFITSGNWRGKHNMRIEFFLY